MINITVVLVAKDAAAIPQLRELLRVQRDLSIVEPGCLRFEGYESDTVPGTFILVERWQDQAALDAHRLAHAFLTNYVPKVLPLVDRVGHICRDL